MIKLTTVMNLKKCYSISATQAVPTFVKEIFGVRAKEDEPVKFDCQYSGNPIPGNPCFLITKYNKCD